MAAEPTAEPWDIFQNTMAQPFVGEVMEGALELRVFGRVTLGHLLKESFDRRFNDPQSSEEFGTTQTGLILNTSIAGHPYDDSAFLKRLFKGRTPEG